MPEYILAKKQAETIEEAKERIVKAAFIWWESHRPVGMTAAHHIQVPYVNLVTEEDRRLAKHIVDLIVAQAIHAQ